MDITVSLSGGSRWDAAAAFTERPTIQRVISVTLVSCAGTSFTISPSRMTTTLSQTFRIS